MAYEATLAAFRRGDNAETARLARLDLGAARTSDDLAGAVDALCMLARVALRDGDLSEVSARAVEAEEVARAAADRRLQRMPLHLNAVAARMAGRYDEGRELYAQSIALNDELGESRMAAAEHRNLAYLEMHAGNAVRARELFMESQRRFAVCGVPEAMVPYLTLDEATVAALDNDHAKAATKLAAAQQQFAQQGVVPDPDDAAEISELRRRLGDASAR